MIEAIGYPRDIMDRVRACQKEIQETLNYRIPQPVLKNVIGILMDPVDHKEIMIEGRVILQRICWSYQNNTFSGTLQQQSKYPEVFSKGILPGCLVCSAKLSEILLKYKARI